MKKTNLMFIPEGAFQSVTLFPSFTCKIAQEPRSPDISVRVEINISHRHDLLSAHAGEIKNYLDRCLSCKRARIYPGLTASISTDGDSIFIELRQKGRLSASRPRTGEAGCRYLSVRDLVNIIRLIEKCVKADFLRDGRGTHREIRKDMFMRGRIVMFVTSRWNHAKVARKVAYIFREFRYRHGCEDNNR